MVPTAYFIFTPVLLFSDNAYFGGYIDRDQNGFLRGPVRGMVNGVCYAIERNVSKNVDYLYVFCRHYNTTAVCYCYRITSGPLFA